MLKYGIISTFYHNDLDVYAGTRAAPDRLPAHNRYFYDVWADFINIFLGPDVPVIIVNNASPVNPENFYGHFPNFEIIGNTNKMMVQGTRRAHTFNFNSALCRGLQMLKEKGIKYGAHIEQDLLVKGKEWLPKCIKKMKRSNADIMGFSLTDLNRFATELFITDVDFWLENQLLSLEPYFHCVEFLSSEVILKAQLKKIKVNILDWVEMDSTRDLHPDPAGVNGVKYAHHRNPDEMIAFLEQSGIKSNNINRLKEFIKRKCLLPYN